MLSKDDRSRITEMGIRMDVMDTAHAAAQYNLLATERSQGQIAAALIVDAFGAKK
jgi:NADH dehydrogenase [ubiquinone] 1 alpha subcomplex assembly factor 3